jgi:hypothetical protein
MLQYCVLSSDPSLLLSASLLLLQLFNHGYWYVFIQLRSSHTLVHVVWLYLNSAFALNNSRRCLSDIVVSGENLPDIEPNPVVNQNSLILNLECTSSYVKLLGLVGIRTQPLSYSIPVGIWAMSSRKENLSDLQTRPSYVSGLSPQYSVLSRHSGDVVVRMENLPDT